MCLLKGGFGGLWWGESGVFQMFRGLVGRCFDWGLDYFGWGRKGLGIG